MLFVLFVCLLFTLGCKKTEEKIVQNDQVHYFQSEIENNVPNNFGIHIDDKISNQYLSQMESYYEKLSQQPAEKIWKNGNAIGAPDTITSMVLIDGRYYEMYVRPGGVYSPSSFFFRSIAENGGFPVKMVIFTYDHVNKKGYLEDRFYSTAGIGQQIMKPEEATEDFQNMLALADRILKI